LPNAAHSVRTSANPAGSSSAAVISISTSKSASRV
jgi:hypothetical protein